MSTSSIFLITSLTLYFHPKRLGVDAILPLALPLSLPLVSETQPLIARLRKSHCKRHAGTYNKLLSDVGDAWNTHIGL